MKLPYSWLKEMLPDAPPVDALVGVLDGLGLSVETVHERLAPPRGVVVVQVETAQAVPGSDHLVLATVTDGQDRSRVVTGAPNTRVGLRTALARPGSTLPELGRVTAHEVAGVTSEGVLCSPRELGLYDYAGGLLVLGEDAVLGAELADLWPAETVIELEITPNRADAQSILGVARDLAAKLDLSLKHPAAGLALGDPGQPTGLRVEVTDPSACSRFTLRLIEGVTVRPSPLWLQRRLAALGLRPRNNVVDVTNYVTFELGGPSHAYDRTDLVDDTIVVRHAEAGETLTALNEARLEFSEDDLLITTLRTDGSGTTPIGVAGVIGGLHHSVKPDTTTVALEVAHFDPVSVRKTAKRLGLSTDAHYRFERGVDPNLPPLASARAATLIALLAGGTLHPGVSEVGGDVTPPPITFRPSRVPFLMAFEVPLAAQRRYLEALGCCVEEVTADHWRVTPPSWRYDLGLEVDLVEEVARLHGYEHIPESIPTMTFVPEGRDTTQRGLRTLLAGMGFQEVMSYVFSSDAELARTAAPAAAVRLASPPSAERSVLRTALYPSLLGVAQTNRALADLALFEVGRVFPDTGEEERLGLLVQGNWLASGWLPGQRADFYLLKGLLERLAGAYGGGLELTPTPHPALHPGVSATVLWNAQAIGYAGRLHPEVGARLELPELYLAELRLPFTAPPMSFQEVARQPFAERDLAVIAPLTVSYAALRDLVQQAAGERLTTLEPFDIYEGHRLPAGTRSVALRLRFRHPERALRDEEVDGFMANVIAAVRRGGYAIRD